MKKKQLNELSLSELKELDRKILSDEEYHLLEENPEVESIECLGQSGYDTNAYWYDVQLTNGENIDIYTRN